MQHRSAQADSLRARIIRLALLLLLATSANALGTEKTLTVHDIYGSSLFSAKSVQGIQWMKSGNRFSYLDVADTSTKLRSIWIYDVKSGKREIAVNAKDLLLPGGTEPFRITTYAWSPAEDQILFTETLPARSLKTGGAFYLYDMKTKSFRQITQTKEPQSIIQFSPDGKHIGFVRENNLFVYDLTSGSEKQLTHDGSATIINGQFDWVYEEEFEIINGYRWSPDSRRIAFWRLDISHEPVYPITDFMPLHPGIEEQRYPNPGDTNAVVKIGVVAVAAGGTKWMDIGTDTDVYIPRIQWTQDPNVLSIQRLNRRQNVLDLLFADVTTGATRAVITERDSAWVSIRNDLTFLKSKRQFIWSSERSGFLHLYLYDYDGKLVNQVTSGDWEVSDFEGVDERRDLVYFTSTKNSPLERQLYSLKLNGRGLTQISRNRGTHSVSFSPTFAYYLDSYSNIETPTQQILLESNGNVVRVLEANPLSPMRDYAIGAEHFITFATSDGVTLNAAILYPVNFDSTKRYPVLFDVYGGPGSQTVRDAWGGTGYLWHQLLAENGYLIFVVDGRGTGGRGCAFEKIVNNQLGKWEVNDQIEGAKYLATLPYVDAHRIGIWGWSYGGYMASLTLLVGADYFKTAVAVAPVTDWKLYDSIYTERYMDTPQHNPKGYEESAPINHAGKLKGAFLVIHGTSDDNVHWQNTIQLVNALEKANKQFRTAFYPNRNHGIFGGATRENLYTRITDFLMENL